MWDNTTLAHEMLEGECTDLTYITERDLVGNLPSWVQIQKDVMAGKKEVAGIVLDIIIKTSSIAL